MKQLMLIQLMALNLLVCHCEAMHNPSAEPTESETFFPAEFYRTHLDQSLQSAGRVLQDATNTNGRVDDLYAHFVAQLVRLYQADRLKTIDVYELADHLILAVQRYIDLYKGETAEVTSGIIATLLKVNALLQDKTPIKMEIKDALMYDIRTKDPENDLGLELSASYSPKSNGDCELRNPLDIFYDQQQVNSRVLF